MRWQRSMVSWHAPSPALPGPTLLQESNYVIAELFWNDDQSVSSSAKRMVAAVMQLAHRPGQVRADTNSLYFMRLARYRPPCRTCSIILYYKESTAGP